MLLPASTAPLSWVPGIELFATPPERPFWAGTVHGYRTATAAELRGFANRTGRSYGGGHVFESIMIDSPRYMARNEPSAGHHTIDHTRPIRCVDSMCSPPHRAADRAHPDVRPSGSAARYG